MRWGEQSYRCFRGLIGCMERGGTLKKLDIFIYSSSSASDTVGWVGLCGRARVWMQCAGANAGVAAQRLVSIGLWRGVRGCKVKVGMAG